MLKIEIPQQIAAKDLSDFALHGGAMMLLEQILSWDEERIVCSATSHGDQTNPLRVHGRLSNVVSVEYAAQAIIYHSILNLLKNQKMIPGAGKMKDIDIAFLGVLRDFSFTTGNLDDYADSPLNIQAELVSMGERIIQYHASVQANQTTISQGLISLVIADGKPS